MPRRQRTEADFGDVYRAALEENAQLKQRIELGDKEAAEETSFLRGELDKAQQENERLTAEVLAVKNQLIALHAEDKDAVIATLRAKLEDLQTGPVAAKPVEDRPLRSGVAARLRARVAELEAELKGK